MWSGFVFLCLLQGLVIGQRKLWPLDNYIAFSGADKCLLKLNDLAVPSSLFRPGAFSVHVNALNMIPPHYVVCPVSERDVQRVLTCATKENVTVDVQHGNSIVGSSVNSLILNMGSKCGRSNNSMCFIRNRTGRVGEPAIEVGAGCDFADVYYTLELLYPGWWIVGGLNLKTSVVRFYLSGGLGLLTKHLGMGVDNVLSIRMATVNGSMVIETNSTSFPELFWGLR